MIGVRLGTLKLIAGFSESGGINNLPKALRRKINNLAIYTR